MKKALFITWIFVTCFSYRASAQLDTTDFSYQYKVTPDPSSIQGMDTLFFHQLNMSLWDTLQVSKIEVTVGSTPTSSDIADHQFAFDVLTFLPKGYNYYRSGNEVELILGEHPAGTYYVEVKLIDLNNNATVAKSKTITQ